MNKIYYVLLIIVLVSSTVFADRRQGRTEQEINKFRAQYQMGADENKEKAWAKNYQPDFLTPVKTAYTMKAFIISGDKQGFLTCLTKEYREKNYPNGVRDYIKYVDYAKYYWLTINGKIMNFEKSAEDSGLLFIKYTFNSNNRLRTQVVKFKMKKQGGKWLFNSL